MNGAVCADRRFYKRSMRASTGQIAGRSVNGVTSYLLWKPCLSQAIRPLGEIFLSEGANHVFDIEMRNSGSI